MNERQEIIMRALRYTSQMSLTTDDGVYQLGVGKSFVTLNNGNEKAAVPTTGSGRFFYNCWSDWSLFSLDFQEAGIKVERNKRMPHNVWDIEW